MSHIETKLYYKRNAEGKCISAEWKETPDGDDILSDERHTTSSDLHSDAYKTILADAETKKETDKTNANQKLKDLGLTDDEIKAIKGIS